MGHYEEMRRDALNILLQSFEILSSGSTNESFDNFCCDMWLQDDLASALLEYLVAASVIPHGAHNAHTAVKCLHLMILNSAKVRATIVDLGGSLESTLQGAIDVGKKSHELLAK